MNELRKFTTDGCSGGLSLAWTIATLWISKPPFEGCCTIHDFAYWKGGTEDERLAADWALQRCVIETGWPRLANQMFRAVRRGGGPDTPTYWPYSIWRWGYGWDPDPRSYFAESVVLTDAQMLELAPAMIGKV